MRIISKSVLMPFTQNYPNQSMLIETTACQFRLVFETQCINGFVVCISTRGQSNLTKSASLGAHSPVRGHPTGSKVVPLNSWGRVSY